MDKIIFRAGNLYQKVWFRGKVYFAVGTTTLYSYDLCKYRLGVLLHKEFKQNFSHNVENCTIAEFEELTLYVSDSGIDFDETDAKQVYGDCWSCQKMCKCSICWRCLQPLVFLMVDCVECGQKRYQYVKVEKSK